MGYLHLIAAYRRLAPLGRKRRDECQCCLWIEERHLLMPTVFQARLRRTCHCASVTRILGDEEDMVETRCDALLGVAKFMIAAGGDGNLARDTEIAPSK